MMMNSFLKLGQGSIFKFSPSSLSTVSSFFFGAKVEPAKAAPAKPQGAGGKSGAAPGDSAAGKAPIGGSTAKIVSTTRFIGVPQRPPLEPGEWQNYEKLTEEEILKSFGANIPKPRHTAYVAVEKRGIVYHLFDAEKIPFGKMCHRIAYYLQGKHNPNYRHDCVGFGDTCVVINASKMKFTGKKIFQKKVKYHSGYVGGLKEIPYSQLIMEKPEQLISRVLSKMLPKNRLRYKYLDNLHVFREGTHNFTHALPNVKIDYFFSYQLGVFHKNYDEIYKGYELPSKEGGDVVIYEDNQDEVLPQFKDIPRQIDEKLLIPFEERGEGYYKTSANNRKIKAEFVKYQRKLRRYKVHTPKPPKDRSLDKVFAEGNSVKIDRDWKIKKFGFQQDIDLVEQEIDED